MKEPLPRRIGARPLRPDGIRALLDSFEARAGARHTVAFGSDGMVLGFAGEPVEEGRVRAEQDASRAFAFTGIASTAWRAWPGAHTDTARFDLSPGQLRVPADHLMLRYRTPVPAAGENPVWRLLVVPAPPWGGIRTELPAEAPMPVPQVLEALRACMAEVVEILRRAHVAEEAHR